VHRPYRLLGPERRREIGTDISGADARHVLTLVQDLEESDSARELQERALPGLIGADAAQRYRFSADGSEVSALSLPRESFHEDPAVIYDPGHRC
jgi:hypothetical protein